MRAEGRCSVVVCTRERPEHLRRCLDFLQRLDHPDFEVIVVENSHARPETEDIARTRGARYLVEPHLGLSRARNTGARAASGEIVAFIDDDAVPEPTWLSRHARTLEDSSLTATTGRILPLGGSPASRTWAALAEDLGPQPMRFSLQSSEWFERANFGGIGVGPNMAFRAEIFTEGWGFRESLGLGAAEPGILGEEHYAFFTLIRTGHTVAYVPDAVVHHGGPRTQAELDHMRRRTLESSSAYVLLLLMEVPGFRSRTLRYVWKARTASRRPWRSGSGAQTLGSKRDLVSAAMRAPRRYASVRRLERSQATAKNGSAGSRGPV